MLMVKMEVRNTTFLVRFCKQFCTDETLWILIFREMLYVSKQFVYLRNGSDAGGSRQLKMLSCAMILKQHLNVSYYAKIIIIIHMAVKEILAGKTMKSCDLDPIPSCIIKKKLGTCHTPYPGIHRETSHWQRALFQLKLKSALIKATP